MLLSQRSRGFDICWPEVITGSSSSSLSMMASTFIRAHQKAWEEQEWDRGSKKRIPNKVEIAASCDLIMAQISRLPHVLFMESRSQSSNSEGDHTMDLVPGVGGALRWLPSRRPSRTSGKVDSKCPRLLPLVPLRQPGHIHTSFLFAAQPHLA